MIAAAAEPSRGGPLSGVRVIELAGLGAAQLGGGLLADLGADVVLIERADAAGASAAAGDTRNVLRRGRRSIAIDLKAPAGVSLATALIERADVVIDPYRPGVTERLGLGPDAMRERNPRLIYARMTAWGQDGPLAATAAHDINVIALSGALHLLGERDSVPPVPLNLVGDFGGGAMLLAFAIAVALFERAGSGAGQVIDVAMIDGVASLLSSICRLDAADGGFSGERHSHWLQGEAPWYRAYRTADGRFVTVGAYEARFYAELLGRLGLDPAQWPQWDRECWPQLSARIAAIFAGRTMADWQAFFAGADVCFAPALRLDELLDDAQIAARETFISRDGVVQPAVAPRFERTPGHLSGVPPAAGQHTLELLEELGVAPAEREALLRAEVVATA